MKNGWLFWVFIVGVVVTVFISFNYEGSKTAVPLSEIFPEDQELAQVEYEFIDSDVVAKDKKNIAVNEETKVEAVQPASREVQAAGKDTTAKATSAVEKAKQDDTKLTFTTTATKNSSVDSIKKAITEAPQNITKAVGSVADKATMESANEGDFAIQVASFKKEESANQELQKVLKKEFPAFIESRNLADKGTWYRVYIGRFSTKEKAGEYLKNVQASYKDSFIKNLK